MSDVSPLSEAKRLEDAMKVWPFAFGTLLILFAMPAAQAQVILDVGKITCDQFLLNEITDEKTISLWLNGYFNGTHHNTIIDTEATIKNAEEVEKYCLSHGKMYLMDAVEKVLGEKK